MPRAPGGQAGGLGGITTILTGFAGQAILVVSGVIVARLLSVDQRGELALLGLLPLIISQLGALGVPQAATYAIASQPGSAAGVARVLWHVMPIRALVLTLVHIGIVTAVFVDEGAMAWHAAIATFPAVPALLAQQIGLGVIQGQQRTKAFNVLRLLPVACYALVLVIVAAAGSGSLLICAAAWTAGWALGGGLTLRMAFHGVRDPGEGVAVERKPFLRFGRRAVLGAIFPLELFQVDQLVVAILLSPGALALYVVAVSVVNLPRFISQSIGLVAFPRIAQQHGDRPAQQRDLWRFFWLAMILSGMIVGALEIAVGRLIPFFFGERYAAATGAARVLLIAALLQAGRRVLADAARGLGHPQLGTIAEVASWIVFVPAVALLQSTGIEGIATALCLASGASLVVLIVGVRIAERDLGVDPPIPATGLPSPAASDPAMGQPTS